MNPNGQTSTWYFEYGKTTGYGTKSATVNAGAGTNDVAATVALTALAANTTYHYRLVATNASGAERTASSRHPAQWEPRRARRLRSRSRQQRSTGSVNPSSAARRRGTSSTAPARTTERRRRYRARAPERPCDERLRVDHGPHERTHLPLPIVAQNTAEIPAHGADLTFSTAMRSRLPPPAPHPQWPQRPGRRSTER